MKYPTLQELNTSRQMIDVFGGYNHNLRIGEGEFYDMENLTSADYPVLSPRPKRGTYAELSDPPVGKTMPGYGMIAKDALCYVDGQNFYINKEKVDGLRLDNTKAEKSLISMGAYVIIMPDKKWVNTQPNDDGEYTFGNIEAEVTASSGTTTFSLCKLEGEEYDLANIPQGDEAPSNPSNLTLWMDTSSIPHTLKQYSTTSDQWVSIATTYIKILFPSSPLGATPLNDVLKDGDGITISGIESTSLSDICDTPIVAHKVGENYIIVTGILDTVITQTVTGDNPITITRKMPEMDFIIESENRLWGCRYGVALNGDVVNEIYASKLGDFKNWNCFAGISTDSYVASVGTDGQFTGAITHLGYPIFFKENCMHKVYGNYPANYQIQTTACRGVQKGCSKSLAIVNETLYYKSRSAVCSYDGSLPVEVSSALGDMAYEDAVAGVLGNKYYISMQDANDKYSLFVYDTARGMWHREDNTQAVDFCTCRGNLYYIDYADADGNIKIKTVKEPASETEGVADTTPIKWKAITGVIGTDSPDKKYISRIAVRLSLEVGTTVSFYAEYDSSGEWKHLFTKVGTKLGSISIPIKPERCDHMRIRIEGRGDAKIYSICKTIEQGSDV